jgi:hypothetical protein
MKDLIEDLTIPSIETQYTPEQAAEICQELTLPPIEQQYDQLEAARLYQELSTFFWDRDCDRASSFGRY